MRIFKTVIFFFPLCVFSYGLPLFWWGEDPEINFGDYLSLKLVERMVECPVRNFRKIPKVKEKKLLAIGSIFYFARDGDVIWGCGINGKTLDKINYAFSKLDIRSVRGPKTRQFLRENFQIDVPEIYGDPALLFPYFFTEFKKKKNPVYDYIIIPHYKDRKLFPKSQPNIVYPTDPWNQVVETILDSKFVISGSLHGIVIAEAYGIPARYLRVSESENMFKYEDYYLGTCRPNFQFARSVEEALEMGGESSFICDLQKVYEAFPFEYWNEET
jgi:pyruvyltransferase